MTPDSVPIPLLPSEGEMLRLLLAQSELSPPARGSGVGRTPKGAHPLAYSKWKADADRIRRKVRRKTGAGMPLKLVERSYYRFDGKLAYIV